MNKQLKELCELESSDDDDYGRIVIDLDISDEAESRLMRWLEQKSRTPSKRRKIEQGWDLDVSEEKALQLPR